jgi:tetratricopeptide (TPR) repeat protein
MAIQEIDNLESLQVLLQQNPDSLTFARVADALMQRGRIDEAIQLCEEGIRRHPYYATGHMVLGKCYLKKKLFDQAEKEFKRVLLFDPKYIAAHKYYGDLMREIGWENTCEMSYRKILQIDPFDEAAKAIIDGFNRKAKSEQPASAAKPLAEEKKTFTQPLVFAPAAPAPPPEASSIDDELFSNIEIDDANFLRYSPPSAVTPNKAPREFETTQAFESAPPSTASPSEEERDADILADIFQDEVMNESSAQAGRGEENRTQQAQYQMGDDKALPVPFRFEDNYVPSQNNKPAAETEYDMTANQHPLEWEKDGFGESQETMLIPAPVERPRGGTGGISARQPSQPEPLGGGGKPLASSSSGEREKIVTPTLGEIYAAQGQYAKAIGVFELLSKKDPNNLNYRNKIDYLKQRMSETQNGG